MLATTRQIATLLVVARFATAQSVFPSPTLITGGQIPASALRSLGLMSDSTDGPRPPNVTSPAPTGTWVAPTTSVVVSGTTYAPPSTTGIGKQAQIIAADNFCLC